MKKLLILLFLVLGITTKSISQVKLYESDSRKTEGLILTVSGIAFTTAGSYEGFYNYHDWIPNNPQYPASGGKWIKKPWYKQGGRPYVIGVGITFTFTGLITIISSKN